ncbi:MAG: SusD/RagB family nutrient-binding outer membrane lipoprotein [Chitinophagaceae bacterium]|nr:SusD/RagB family nutrient-binding outer membrane lipoprotein [Chitinophagaceae bacterium]
MKNRLNIFSMCLILIITGTFASCDKRFKEINTSVDFVSTPNLDYMLPNIELTILDNTYYCLGDFAAAYVMHVTNRKSYESVTTPGGYHGYHFEWTYPNPFRNVVDFIERSSQDPERINYKSMGRIIKVYLAHQLTDLYGDVPYSEAAKGYSAQIYTPKYDKQQDIYNDMFKELEEAALAFDNAKMKPVTSDIVYKGDIVKWKKFAYSLMLRLGLRIMKADAVKGKAMIEKAIAGGVFQNNDDNFMVKYLPNSSTGGTTNPTSNGQPHIFVRYPDNYRLTAPFINQLKSTQDPRLPVFAMLPASRTTYSAGSKDTAVQKGWPPFGDRRMESPYGSIPSAERLIYSTANNATFGRYDAPYIHLSYAQVQFQLAECVVRGIITSSTTAQTYYENGVRAAMDQLKHYGSEGVISTARVNTYIAYNPYNPANTEQALELINTQYWIETFFNWYETFANLRRSGYPKLYENLLPSSVHPANLNAQMPRRLTYMAAEIASNPNVQEVFQRQGPDVTSTRVWWDKP